MKTGHLRLIWILNSLCLSPKHINLLEIYTKAKPTLLPIFLVHHFLFTASRNLSFLLPHGKLQNYARPLYILVYITAFL